ncbi:MAG: (d)CMP kinase, partial [Coriobacteriia bacterium]|nr:(d)CMP kinase [Coriobacteriia bacterium]
VRDERDTSREIAPLTRADDAVQLDSTNLTEEEVIDTIVDLAHARCAQTEG